MKHLLGIEGMQPEEIVTVLDTADAMLEISQREIKRVPTLRGRTVINVFLEPSTRTRVSFEIAAKRLSADAVNVSAAGSSLAKAETLADMVQNLAAMNADVLIVRDRTAGVPRMLAERVHVPVINAGDGQHEHPTQALLDAFTVRQSLGSLEGRVVAIIGDIAHSRVARSDIYAFTKLGAEVRVAAPATMMPPGIELLGVKPCESMAEALAGADVIVMLRIQQERLDGPLFPGVREYARTFGLTQEKLTLASPDAIVLHPGPLNRGVEIATEVADAEPSRILDQVTNGVAVRMAVLYLVTGAE
ncbi:MAG: aspartate carbamoyltransferase catalytic subunit [Deltaproteobacteria bacterium]|nr:MAG: aspartate carbamoyltransferase catalytic subunit [Deltaproteobacteria bacterium]TDJ07041.1 MAG: aspartate carbamoyltransferase catalytic subunit [Deltaproteobacteria bacterium]